MTKQLTPLDQEIIKQFSHVINDVYIKLDKAASTNHKSPLEQIKERLDLTMLRYLKNVQLHYVFPIKMKSFRLIKIQNTRNGYLMYYDGYYSCGSYDIHLITSFTAVEKYIHNYGEAIYLKEGYCMIPDKNTKTFRVSDKTPKPYYGYGDFPTYGGSVWKPFTGNKPK